MPTQRLDSLHGLGNQLREGYDIAPDALAASKEQHVLDQVFQPLQLFCRLTGKALPGRIRQLRLPEIGAVQQGGGQWRA